MEGNQMKMREALEKALYFLRRHHMGAVYAPDGETLIYCDDVAKIVDEALSAPARNCDKYSHDEALHVWAAEKEGPNNGCFDEWLYHDATEGGAK